MHLSNSRPFLGFARSFYLVVILAVTGCSDNGETTNGPNPEFGDVSAYTPSALRELVADGASEKAVRVLRARSQTRTASIADYMLLAEIHIGRLEPVEASSALERAEDKGATKQTLALLVAETLMLQGRFDAASNELRLTPLIGSKGFKAAMLNGKIDTANNNVASARRYFNLARKLDANSPEPEIELTLLEFSTDNLDAAFELAQNVKTNPAAAMDPRPDFILGAISRLRRDNKQAINFLEMSLEKNPSGLLTQLELVGAWLDTGKQEKAQKILDQILARAPDNSVAQFYVAYILRQNGQNSAAIKLINEHRFLLSQYRPAKKLYANAAYDAKDFDNAAKYFRQYLSEVPGDVEVRLKLASSLQRLGQPSNALRIITPALPDTQIVAPSTPSSPVAPIKNTVTDRVTITAIAQAGYAELAQNNIDAARTNFDRALALATALDPADDSLTKRIMTALATLDFNSGDSNTGIVLMKKVVSLGTPTTDQLATLANMQILSRRLQGATKSIEQMEQSPLKNNLMGTLAMRHEDYDTAIESFSAAISVNPNYHSAIKNRAAAYIEKNKFNEALNDLRRLEQFANGDGQYYAMLARVQQRLGNFVAAINAFEAALDLTPNSASLNANYALVLGEKKRYVDAVSIAKKALELLPQEGTATIQIRGLIGQWETAIEKSKSLADTK